MRTTNLVIFIMVLVVLSTSGYAAGMILDVSGGSSCTASYWSGNPSNFRTFQTIDLNGTGNSSTGYTNLTVYAYLSAEASNPSLPVWIEIWTWNGTGKPHQFYMNSTTTVNASLMGTSAAYYNFSFGNQTLPKGKYAVGVINEVYVSGTKAVYWCRLTSNAYAAGSPWTKVNESGGGTQDTASEFVVILNATANATSGGGGGGSDSVTFVGPTPTDGVSNYTSPVINMTSTNNRTTLWWGATASLTDAHKVLNNVSMGTDGYFIYTPNLTTDGTYYYKAAADSTANTTARTFTYDTNFKLNIIVNDTVDGVLVSDFNVTINGTIYPNNNQNVTIPWLDPLQSYNFNITANGYVMGNGSATMSGYSINRTVGLTWDQARLNVTSYGYLTGALVSTYRVLAYNGTSLLANTTAAGGSAKFALPNNWNYTIIVDAAGYALQNKTVEITTGNHWVNFTLNETNSLNITIRDESSLNIISGVNISIYLTGVIYQYNYSTSTGTLYTSGIQPDTYTVLLTSTGYADRTYLVTMNNRSSQYLAAYMTLTSGTTIFTFRNSVINTLLPNVATTMYRSIGGTWTAIESKTSDIGGTAQFTYTPSTAYQFVSSLNGYDDLVFTLNPVQYSTYNLYMVPSTGNDQELDYETVNIILQPDFYRSPLVNNFTYNIQAPTGSLIQYGALLSWSGGSETASVSGVNAYGSRLITTLNITGATALDTVRVDYYYETTLAGVRNFTRYYPITVPSQNTTFMQNQDSTYGLSPFERILIATLLLLLVVGVAAFVGRPLAGSAMGLFVLGWMVAIGFVPVWTVLITFTIGLLLLSVQGGR